MERFIILLISICLWEGALTKSIQVIEFQSGYTSTDNAVETLNLGLKTTRSLTMCFRFMSRFHRGYLLFKTRQMELWIKYTNGFVNLYPWNSASAENMYARTFKFCQPRVPGKWMALCISINMTENTQNIKVFQDGHLCWNMFYADGSYDLIYYKSSTPIKDMYEIHETILIT